MSCAKVRQKQSHSSEPSSCRRAVLSTTTATVAVTSFSGVCLEENQQQRIIVVGKGVANSSFCRRAKEFEFSALLEYVYDCVTAF